MLSTPDSYRDEPAGAEEEDWICHMPYANKNNTNYV